MIGARTARLVLGSLTLPLDSPAGGWACTSLDLGQPDIREVKDSKPDQHGTIDRTAYMGSRLVTALISSWPEYDVNGNPLGSIDDVIEQFGPFLDPSARPVLHVTTYSNAPERTLVLRVSQYSGGLPMTQPPRRDAQFQWVAADPVLRDVNVQTSTAYAGSAVLGRQYPRVFNQTYPPAGAAQSNGSIQGLGQIPIRPVLNIYGPITTPKVQFTTQQSGQNFQVWFMPGFYINAGHYVAVDTLNRTILQDGTTPTLGQLDWSNTVWPVLPNSPDSTAFSLTYDSTGLQTTSSTQCQATWQDGYLT